MKMMQMYGMGGFGPPSLDFMNQLNRNKESTIKNKKKIEEISKEAPNSNIKADKDNGQ